MDARRRKPQKWQAKPGASIRINGTIIRASRRVVLTIETTFRIRRMKGKDEPDGADCD